MPQGLKRPHCPIHCTFIVRKYSRSESGKPHTVPTVSHRFAGLNWEKTLIPQATDLPFPRYACLPSRNFWIAWDPLSIDGQHEWSLQHPELECSNARMRHTQDHQLTKQVASSATTSAKLLW